MSSFIGNRSEFAVEFFIDHSLSSGRSPYGNMRIWIHDTYVGNFGDTDYLSHLQFKLNWCLRNYRRLENPYLNSLDDEQLIAFFNVQKSAIENYDDEIDIDKYYFGRIPSFDDFCVLCLYASGKVRFTWKLYDTTNFIYPDYPRKALGAHIDLEIFQRVVAEFYKIGPGEG